MINEPSNKYGAQHEMNPVKAQGQQGQQGQQPKNGQNQPQEEDKDIDASKDEKNPAPPQAQPRDNTRKNA